MHWRLPTPIGLRTVPEKPPASRTDEAWRRECEARQWIREGYFQRDRVDGLMERIASRRGAEAAAALREEMRRQWTRRAEWLEESTP